MTPTISPSGRFQSSPTSRTSAAPGPTPCATNNKVIDDLRRRAALGYAKYGTTVADNPLARKLWMVHAYEEALDFAVYLRRLIDMEEGECERKDNPF